MFFNIQHKTLAESLRSKFSSTPKYSKCADIAEFFREFKGIREIEKLLAIKLTQNINCLGIPQFRCMVMVNYWIVGAWNIRHALRNGIIGEWMIDIVHSIRQNDRALVYVLKESEHNPSGKGAGCFIGGFIIDSDPQIIHGPWIFAEHVYEEKVEHEGFKLRDFRLWNSFISGDEARQQGVNFDLGMLRAGKGMCQISREAYLKITDIYAKKVEETK